MRSSAARAAAASPAYSATHAWLKPTSWLLGLAAASAPQGRRRVVQRRPAPGRRHHGQPDAGREVPGLGLQRRPVRELARSGRRPAPGAPSRAPPASPGRSSPSPAGAAAPPARRGSARAMPAGSRWSSTIANGGSCTASARAGVPPVAGPCTRPAARRAVGLRPLGDAGEAGASDAGDRGGCARSRSPAPTGWSIAFASSTAPPVRATQMPAHRRQAAAPARAGPAPGPGACGLRRRAHPGTRHARDGWPCGDSGGPLIERSRFQVAVSGPRCGGWGGRRRHEGASPDPGRDAPRASGSSAGSRSARSPRGPTCSTSFLSLVENGRSDISTGRLFRVARFLGVGLGELLDVEPLARGHRRARRRPPRRRRCPPTAWRSTRWWGTRTT